MEYQKGRLCAPVCAHARAKGWRSALSLYGMVKCRKAGLSARCALALLSAFGAGESKPLKILFESGYTANEVSEAGGATPRALLNAGYGPLDVMGAFISLSPEDVDLKLLFRLSRDGMINFRKLVSKARALLIVYRGRTKRGNFPCEFGVRTHRPWRAEHPCHCIGKDYMFVCAWPKLQKTITGFLMYPVIGPAGNFPNIGSNIVLTQHREQTLATVCLYEHFDMEGEDIGLGCGVRTKLLLDEIEAYTIL